MRTGLANLQNYLKIVCTLPALATSVLLSSAITARAESDSPRSRLIEIGAQVDRVPKLQVSMTPISWPGDEGGVAGDCPPKVVAHTDSTFGAGSYIVQAGFAEGEIAAAQYVVPAADFPLRIDLIEMIFATSGTTVTTTTQWSVLVWEGPPNTGNLVATYSSDGTILPHIVIPPGNNGVNVQVSVDPNDPEQIILQNNGSNSFTVGFRIDDHHNEPANPCTASPPSNSNAFPTTDTSGLAQPMRNWLYALDCGVFACPGGWSRFSDLPNSFPFLCRPSGDWVLRATYTPVFCSDVQGACCLNDGSCLGPVAQATCLQTLNGNFQGQGSVCLPGLCPQPTQACCFMGNPPTCSNLSANDCGGFGGIAQGTGTNCATTVCFPRGACCSPLGTCTNDVAQEDCVNSGGTFQGNNVQCSSVNCPQPNGACCSNTTTFCSAITQANCAGIPNTTWAGPLTTCADNDMNGEADACESGTPCIVDQNCNDNNACTCDKCNAGTCVNTEVEFGNVNCSPTPVNPNLDDILCVLAGFASFSSCPAGDIAPTTGTQACQGNGTINLDDILAVLAAFSGADPCNCVPG